MPNQVIRVRYDTCPQCGGTVTVQHIEQAVAVYTGDIDEEGWPEVETLTATGWTAECQRCPWSDCEPPQL